MEVATGRFKEQPAGMDVTKLETSMSFLQIKASMGLHEKIWQVRHEICQNRRETAQVRLEAIAGADKRTKRTILILYRVPGISIPCYLFKYPLNRRSTCCTCSSIQHHHIKSINIIQQTPLTLS
jgi:hypothetical protein